ncbi:hypothetical protein A2V56_03265 [Candidatus Woesebacteria bacterium RBG_19FT_COMBO_42_9]|uniref:AB hydrolase-1 domain-containing protein n=1 Tax=Candidatus Woesebacteria bacterium RBG_16_42_24 TaxID=1802485 RepID=A0A1F7XK16_9BACT|nr:MAG: hypothetical protein A2V97_01840 [Candidatus Woesebacteria bacterium RBG_16_42_24]OGM16396.1 MAG: hypothetical protein A2V56_03265 [Candidatus Woesebacteria bacterium RBG_19FT_COMBO_42_9]OGM67325.1 MAG: hypothetical protein A2985_04180 [Candidatus Woesebacteria bacterium RIFCSPLOWO2_01_FULL_43_11]
MKTIILPGYSLHNKDWAQDLKRELNLGHEIIVHNWEHWQGKASLSPRRETARILQELGEGEVNIIAKSVGTFICVILAPNLKGRVRKVILCGIPSVSNDRKEKFIDGLREIPSENVICFQNAGDPFASYDEVKIFLAGVSPKIKVIKKERSDHSYPYPEEFTRFLNE